MIATIDPGTASHVGVVLAKNPNGSEYTKIYYDFDESEFVIDRTQSSTNPNVPRDVVRENYSIPANSSFTMHCYVDGSVIEVFIDEKAAFTTRIFPEDINSGGIDLFASGGTADFSDIKVWTMKDSQSLGIFNPGTENNNGKKIFKNVWPNPSDSDIHFDYVLDEKSDCTIKIYSITGIHVKTVKPVFNKKGNNSFKWNGMDKNGNRVKPQLYFARIYINNIPLDTVKFVIH
jgi:hypothetical protein